MRISFNGALVDVETVACTPNGWLSGDGIFETLRTINGVVYAYSRHITRAKMAAQIAQIELPELDLVEKSVRDVINAEPHPDGLLRISFGSSGLWAVVHLPYKPVTNPALSLIHI